jgi:hypothetical protein
MTLRKADNLGRDGRTSAYLDRETASLASFLRFIVRSNCVLSVNRIKRTQTGFILSKICPATRPHHELSCDMVPANLHIGPIDPVRCLNKCIEGRS